jgi:hypothetical protein
MPEDSVVQSVKTGKEKKKQTGSYFSSKAILP